MRLLSFLFTHGGLLAGTVLDFKGSSMSIPVLITVSNALNFSSHESLFPTRKSRLTS